MVNSLSFIKLTMEQISTTINKLITDTYGGVIIFWFALFKVLNEFLKYAGKKIAEGANNDFIKKLMPDIEKKLNERLQEIENKIELKLEDLKHSVNAYKDRKHNLENEYSIMLRAILDKDEDSLDIIRRTHEEKKH